MIASPEWATWSLESSKATPTVIVSQYGSPQDGTLVDGGAGLFTKTPQNEVLATEWHDFEEDEDQQAMTQAETSEPQVPEAADINELFKNTKDTRKRSPSQDQEANDFGQYLFDPLSPVESRELQRALKLSKYIPPSQQEAMDEKQRIMGLKVINGRKKGTTINAETGKRVYHAASRGTGLVRKENNEAKDVFQAMCKSMLPRRHFDWILAQLTYHKCNMIGFDDVPSSRTLLQQEAKESVMNGSMEMHNLAHVTRLLAEASKVDTSAFDVVDPTKGARQKGGPTTAVKHKMMMQSNAVFESLKVLFPEQFRQGSIPEDKAAV